jgi:hypothetical protein
MPSGDGHSKQSFKPSASRLRPGVGNLRRYGVEMTSYELFKKYEVQADSIEDFLSKYTKFSRHRGRGQEYVEARIKSHTEDFNEYGFTFLTQHDSVTGEHVSYYGKEVSNG